MAESAAFRPMLFNSWEFLVFAAVVYGLYFCLPRRGQNWMLLIASYVFYGAWDYRFLLLLFGSTVVDYWVGLRLGETDDPRQRRRLLALSLGTNLSALGFFKYFDFFVDSAISGLESLGFVTHLPHLDIILPVGISFYAFQSMSYAIDVYRRQLEPVASLRDFALYISYFPQLVAGPIERATRLVPQIIRPRTVLPIHWWNGAWFISWGLFKKMVIADNLAIVVDRAFLPGSGAGGLEYLLAIYAFAFQIYCDFSGYSDVARGLAYLMGIELMVNFDRPYSATSVREYWRRWHISLSTWLQDYLFVPLGGSRYGLEKTCRNLMVTMLLGGLWHGAAWTFVLWGAYHGVLLAAGRWYDTVRPGSYRVRTSVDRIFWQFVTFNLICFGYLVFRSETLAQSGEIIRTIATRPEFGPATIRAAALAVPFVALLWVVEASTSDDGPRRPLPRAIAVALFWLGIIVLSPPNTQSFIYFQF